MPTVSYPNCPCCETQSGSGSGSGGGTPVTTIICDTEAVEVPEDLEVEFSGGTGASACLDGLIYDLFFVPGSGGGFPAWENPEGALLSGTKICLCVDQYRHHIAFLPTCTTSLGFIARIVLGTSTPPPDCGFTGSSVGYGDSVGSFSGNGDTFVYTGTLTQGSGGVGSVDVTIRKRSS